MNKKIVVIISIVTSLLVIGGVFLALLVTNRVNLDYFVAFNKPVRTTFVLGDVYRQTEKFDWQQLIVGDQLPEKTRVKNEKKSTTDLRFHPNTYVRLSQNTTIRITQNKTNYIELDLQQGGVYIKSYKHNPKQRILIKHSAATIEIYDKTWAFIKVSRAKNNVASLAVYTIKGAVGILQNKDDYHIIAGNKAVTSGKVNPPYITYTSRGESVALTKVLTNIYKSEHLIIPTKILFKPGSYIIESNAEGDLKKVFNILDKTDYHIFIEGHTDASGDALHNFDLSTNRSKAIIKYFVDKDIDRDRFRYRSFGEAVPIASNRTRRGRLINRRVEFKVIDPNEEENESEESMEEEEEL